MVKNAVRLRSAAQKANVENLATQANLSGLAHLVTDMAESLFQSVDGNVERARKLCQSAREGRALAKTTMARARLVRRRVHTLDSGVAQAREPEQIKRRLSLREDALDALKQSLADLESLLMVLPDDKWLDKLKADIRKTLERSR